jgi:hypothetical protein
VWLIREIDEFAGLLLLLLLLLLAVVTSTSTGVWCAGGERIND